uniref:Uncharacterized protein n=1 Tax=Palpitomonas bilix TaxID=652834 RepID=A0A7S3DBF5_9EUKA|mmetsp:Transcript_28070/g.71551  ORF Transcript_28070/g.71551 Transcript_28070/m.71551 type:complete len:216 (+) Transcript_28070:336-983(+)
MGPEFEVYSLFVSSDDFRLELNMLDTILFRDGLPVLWLFTNKDGKVMRKKDTNTTLAKARDYFLKKALEDTKVNYTKTVCSYSADTPDAATMDGVEFARFMDYLAKVKTVDEQLPCCIHLFKKPCFDMCYICTFHKIDATYSVESVPVKYDRRYNPGCRELNKDRPVAEEFEVDGAVKRELERLVLSIVSFITDAHNKYADTLVCEFIEDVRGKV